MACHMLHLLQTRLYHCNARGLDAFAEYIQRQIKEHQDGGYISGILAPPCSERNCVTPEEWEVYATRRRDVTNSNARGVQDGADR